MEVASTIGEESESFTLLIKNLPVDKGNTSTECLLDFIKRLTWQENVEISEAGSDSYFVQFINVPTDAEEVMQQLKQETFRGAKLEVTHIKKMRKLYVANLKQNIQQIEICLYLEQPMFVPPSFEGDYRVEVLHIDRQKKYALVKIPDEADIGLYANAQHSDILGEHLHISEYKGKARANSGQSKMRWKSRGKGFAQRQRPSHATNSREAEYPLPSPSTYAARQLSQQALLPLPDIAPLPLQATQMKFDKNCPNALKGLPFVEWIQFEEVDREKCQLMKKLLVELRKSLAHGWKVWIDERNHRIGVGHCDEMKLHAILSVVNTMVSHMASTFLHLPKEFAMVLKSSKGYSFIIKFFEERQLRVVYFYDNTKQRGMVLGENREVARSAAEAMINDFSQVFSDGTFIMDVNVRVQEWNAFAAGLMKEYLVYISLKVDDYGTGTSHVRRVMLQGFKSDPNFMLAKCKVEEKLKDLSLSQDMRCLGLKSKDESQEKNYHEKMGSSHSVSQSSHNVVGPSPLLSSSQSDPNFPLNPHKDNEKLKNSELSKVNKSRGRQRGRGAARPDSQDRKANVDPSADSQSIKMSPLAYKFIKMHVAGFSANTTKYLVPDERLVFLGKEDEVLPLLSTVKSLLTTLKEKQATIKIAGITEGYFNEKNSELRTEISKFELNKVFAINFKTDKDTRQTLLLYAYLISNSEADKFPETIKEVLMKFSKRKIIDCNDLFQKVGVKSDVMTEKLIKSITKIQHSHVKINFDIGSNTIVLQGREKFFDSVVQAITDVIVGENSCSSKPMKVIMNQPLRHENLPEFLRLVGHEDIYAPDHWSTFTGNLRNVSSNRGGLVPLLPDSDMYKYVLNMVNQTWKFGIIGVGRDASKLCHRNIEVVKVYSVENVFQYKRYMTRVKEFCLQNSVPGFTSLDNKVGFPILTRGAAYSSGMSQLLWEINECHLFHGTRFEKKNAIIDQGLDFRLGSQHALFGQGIYFAESSTKADQYADSREDRSVPGDNLYMFVARVFLGKMYEATRPEAFKRPPCNFPGCFSDTCSIHPLNDSVLGTHTTTYSLTHYNALTNKLKTLQASNSPAAAVETEKIKKLLQDVRPLLFREFVVYDHAQCFPEFLVEYKRI